MILNRVLEFNVSAFGIKTGLLIRAFAEVTADLQNFLLTFVDDVHARSDTFEEHLKHLELLFIRALKYNITFNFAKSIFCHKHIEFLGYILTPTDNSGPGKNDLNKMFQRTNESKGNSIICRFRKFLLEIRK